MNMLPNHTLLHGGDYNPDQWLDRPDILEQDIVLMKEAHVNCVSLAIFAWARLEPEEGKYDFDWLIKIVDDLYKNGIYTILATPSGARPAWMAEKYPEVLRMDDHFVRQHMGARHNHCFTSPVYRDKVYEINRRLSQTFLNHPGVVLWHISNEYGGTCYCPLCCEAFRGWVKDRYKTLDAVNQAWWTPFWSHTYTSWSQIEPPSPIGETNTHGLTLSWKRFTTDQTVDFCKKEKEAIRAGGSQLPVTANFMEIFEPLNYFKFKDVLEVISWDSYPSWHMQDSDTDVAVHTAFAHDLIRSLKKETFLLMESTPSTQNWKPLSKLKKPGMHMLSSMQAIAHGADSVQYFQWRKGRGGSEKFHGAVVDHYGKSDTRVFRDVEEVGKRLERLSFLKDAPVKPQVAIFFDWENYWAVEDAAGPRNAGIHYVETIEDHYRAFWNMGIPVDFVDMECDLESYKLVVAPLLYMYRSGIQDRLRSFVKSGGVLAGTYLSGIVDENDLCILDGVPGGMTDVFGLREEEIDALCDGEENTLCWNNKIYRIRELCARPILSGAETLAEYGEDFYKGEPALTRHIFGKGTAYYLAGRAESSFYPDFYRQLSKDIGIKRAFPCEDFPSGVTAGERYTKDGPVVILQNFSPEEQSIYFSGIWEDTETKEKLEKTLTLKGWEVRFLKE